MWKIAENVQKRRNCGLWNECNFLFQTILFIFIMLNDWSERKKGNRMLNAFNHSQNGVHEWVITWWLCIFCVESFARLSVVAQSDKFLFSMKLNETFWNWLNYSCTPICNAGGVGGGVNGTRQCINAKMCECASAHSFHFSAFRGCSMSSENRTTSTLYT